MNTFITLENNLKLEEQPANQVAHKLLEIGGLAMVSLQYFGQLLLQRFTKNADTAIAEVSGLDELLTQSNAEIRQFLTFSFPAIKGLVNKIEFFAHTRVLLQPQIDNEEASGFGRDMLLNARKDHLFLFNGFGQVKTEIERFMRSVTFINKLLDERSVEEKATIANSPENTLTLENLETYISAIHQVVESISLATAVGVLSDRTRRTQINFFTGAKKVGNIDIPITVVSKNLQIGYRLYNVRLLNQVIEGALPSSQDFSTVKNGLIYLESHRLSRKALLAHLQELLNTIKELEQEWGNTGAAILEASDTDTSTLTPEEKEAQEKVVNMTLDRLHITWMDSILLSRQIGKELGRLSFSRIVDNNIKLDSFDNAVRINNEFSISINDL